MNSTFKDITLLLFRLAAGCGMLIGHGWGKLSRYLADGEISFSDPIGLGQEASFVLVLFAEVLCAAFVAIGLFTRLATIPLIITMLVVIFAVQLGNPFNKLELPLLYLAGFLLILAYGPGRYSLDGVRNKL